ncbi:MAG: GTP cyclohydrolase I FolE, partial [Acidobacteria bacterium]
MNNEERFNKLKFHVEEILKLVGENPEREGLVDTPKRVAKMYLSELLTGYKQSIDEVVNGAIFRSDYQEMIVVRDIDFYSMCEHH